jgi:predicted Zn-dependent protease with MMP-like domain
LAYHVSKARFGELVEQAIELLPERFREFLEEVPVQIEWRPSKRPVQIEWRPSKRMLRSVGLDDDELLMGLYQGANFMDRSEVEGRGTPAPNHILIFQEDHELVARNERQLVDEVRKTVLHEIGHHFGMDENDLDELGYA